MTTKYVDQQKNPTVVSASVKYSSDNLIIKVDGSSFNGIGIKYDDKDGSGLPQDTTVTLTPKPGTKTVSKIQTTQVGGNAVSPPEDWTFSNGVYSYKIPSKFIGSEHHTINFKVIWSDNTGHDPLIVINPPNN